MKLALTVVVIAALLCALVSAAAYTRRKDRERLKNYFAYAKAGESRVPRPDMDDEEEYELWQFRAERLQRSSNLKQLDRYYKTTKRRIHTLERHLQRRLPTADYKAPQLSDQPDTRSKLDWLVISLLPELELSDYLESAQELYELRTWREIIEEIASEHVSPSSRAEADELAALDIDDLKQ